MDAVIGDSSGLRVREGEVHFKGVKFTVRRMSWMSVEEGVEKVEGVPGRERALRTALR